MTHPHPRTATPRVALALAACAIGGACFNASLEQVAGDTPCAAGKDACEADGIRPLAVGAHMPVEVSPKVAAGGQIPATHMRVVDDDVAVDDQGRVRGVGAGVTAVLFVTDDERVLDLTHIAVAQPARLVFLDDDDTETANPLVLASGARAHLRLVAKSDSQTLGGDLQEQFLVDDPAFTLLPEPGGVVIEAPEVDAPAQALLTAGAIGLSVSLVVEVRP